MAVRVTRRYSDVLLSTDQGKLRVSRHYLEALVPVTTGNAYDLSASDTLVLDDDVAVGKSLSAEASDSLSLDQAASPGGKTKTGEGRSVLSLSATTAYVGPRAIFASSPITLVDSPYIGQMKEASAASGLAFSVPLGRSGTLRVSAANSLTLAVVADTREFSRQVTEAVELLQAVGVEASKRVTNTLSLTQQAQQGVVGLTASSQIELDQLVRPNPRDIGPGKGIDLPATAITLADVATSSIRMLAAGDQLEITDRHNVIRPHWVDAVSPLIETEEVYDEELMDFVEVATGLSDSAAVTLIQGQSLRQYLQLADEARAVLVKPGAIDLAASDWLVLDQRARLSLTAEVTSRLALADAVEVHLVHKRLTSTLELSQAASVLANRDLDPLSDLDVFQTSVFVLESAGNRYQYTPFIGENSDPGAPAPPSPTLPTSLDGILAPFQLVYPAEGPVQASVTLRAPEFGNKDRLQFNRINRETRGGTLIIYADPIWPKTETLVLTFSALLQQQAQDLLAFVQDYLGQEIGLVDHEHRYWRGVITNPDEAVVQDGPNRFTASIEFEGELDPSWHAQVIPTRIYGVSRAAQEPRPDDPLPYVDEMAGDIEYYTAEVDAAVQVGTPIYLTATGHARPAQAHALPQAGVAGIAIGAAQPTFACHYITEGKVTRDDWSPVSGAVALFVGQVYFLDPANPGRITATSPSVSGQYVVRIGRAVSPLTLDVEVEHPIRL